MYEQIDNILNGASRYENGKWIKSDGFWARISRRFAAETTGDAYSLCGTAAGDRIFAMDELPAWLEGAADDAKLGGFTKTELLAMGENERFDAVKNWTIDDMKDSKVYFDANGNKIGQTFDNTSLNNKVGNVIPDEYASEKNAYDYITEKNESANKDVKEEIGDSETRGNIDSEVKEEVSDSETKKDPKEELDESVTKQDTSDTEKEIGESSANQENVSNESDFENKKPNTDATGADTDIATSKSEAAGDLNSEHASDESKVADKVDADRDKHITPDGESSETVDKSSTENASHTTPDGESSETVDKGSTENASHATPDGESSAAADKGSTENASHTTPDEGSSVTADKGSTENTSHTTPDGESSVAADKGSTENASHTTLDEGSSVTADKGSTENTSHTTPDGGDSTVADKGNTGNTSHATPDGGSSAAVDKGSQGKPSQTTPDGGNSAAADKGSQGNTNHTTPDGGNNTAADKASQGNSSHTTPDGSSSSGNIPDGLADAGTKSQSGTGANKNKTPNLTDNGQKLVDSFEEASGNKVNLDGKSGLAKKINKCADVLDKAGKGFDILDAGKMIYDTATKLSKGDVDGACKVMSDYGFSTLGGMGAGALAALILSMGAVNPVLGFAFLVAMGWWGSEMGEKFSDWWYREVLGLYDQAGAYTYPVDPLILDLDGDGIETISVKDGVNFDFDNNGFAEKTGWVGKDDGLLVRDINHNGQIDNGSELFGDVTAADGYEAENGFEALKYFDANGDNIINHLDDIYSELRVWQDANQNGKVDAGELHGLEELGIAGLDLNHENIYDTDANGNFHTQKSIYIKTDGSTAVMEDVWFGKDAANTVVIESDKQTMQDETNEILRLPDIPGKGNQYSLHQAMLYDETGKLKQMVEDYVAETDRAVRKSMLPELIYVWAGVNKTGVASRGSGISDARRLATLEVVSGRTFVSAYGSNPVRQAGIYLEQAFDKLVNLYFELLEMQTTYADEYVKLYINSDMDETGKHIFDLTAVAEKYMAGYEDNPVEGKNRIYDFVDNLRKTGMDKTIGKGKICEAFPIAITDLYHAIDYRGDDVISGTYGNDTIIGEMGNDRLKGGNGDDTYLFSLWDGQDTIEETNGNDRIVFGEGISEEDIEVTRDRWNLYLTNRRSGDRINIQNFFNDTTLQVEEVRFADGTSWSVENLKDKARYYYGTDGNDSISAQNSYDNAPTYEEDYIFGGAGNDTLRGNNGNDELYGEEGNDTLEGGTGDDILDGGTGNDRVKGGVGDDAYVFNLGDGQDIIEETNGNDRIVFGEGITAEDIEVTRDRWNLYLTNRRSNDRINIQNFFSDTTLQVEEVRFADGTSWSAENLKDKARYYYGTDGNDSISAQDSYGYAPTYEEDYLYGGAGNDTLRGNSGNDELYGEEGNDTLEGGTGDDILNGGTGNDRVKGGVGDDTYVFNLGDGQDIIEETNGNDRIMFGEGINSEDLTFSKNRNDLTVSIIGQEDEITVLNYFSDESYRVESIQTSDGTEFDYTRIELMIQAMAAFDDSKGMMMEAVNQNVNEQSNDSSKQMWTKALYSYNG